MTEFKYRPDVDGLRAVAVILVLLFHGGLGFPGGYVGVDVFFVISGFLITGLILKEQHSHTFSLAGFWRRRIRRIMPAATVAGVAILAAGAVFLLPADLKELASSLIAQQAMVANVYFWQHANYFAGPSETMPLLHTWSLAVEEQFYLGFPLLLIALKRFSPRSAAKILLAIAALSLLVSEYGARWHPGGAFFLLPTRAWELLVGALLVYCPEPHRMGRMWREAGAWAGIGLILASGIWFNAQTTFPGIAAVLPCLGTMMVIYFNALQMTSIGTVLASKPVVFVGLISYSLYLWHWPILALTRYWLEIDLPFGTTLVALASSVLVAIASWRFVETPFRKGFSSIGTTRVIGSAMISAAAVIAACLSVNIQQGWPIRLPEHVRKIAEPLKFLRDYEASMDQIRDGHIPVLGLAHAADQPPDFIVWGDSHAMALGDCFDALAAEKGLCGVIAARNGTLPILGVWRPDSKERDSEAPFWTECVLDYVRQRRIKNVILVGRWDVNIEGRPNGEMDSLIAERDSASAGVESARMAFENGLGRTLNDLEELDASIWILKQVPSQPFSPQRKIVRAVAFGSEIPRGVSLAAHQLRQGNANSIIDRQVEGRRGVQAIDLSQSFFDVDGFSVLGSQSGSYYLDENHVSDFGANELLRNMLENILLNMDESRRVP